MTQRTIERLLGRLLTDEVLRDRFQRDPERTVAELAAEGWELTETERAALAGLDRGSLGRFAGRLDPRIRKVALRESRAANGDEPAGYGSEEPRFGDAIEERGES